MVPVVIFAASRFGTSAATKLRKVGAAALPVVGPAKTKFALWLASAAVRVPEEVTGEPETVKMAGMDSATLVTVPDPPPPDPITVTVPVQLTRDISPDRFIYRREYGQGGFGGVAVGRYRFVAL
jgi:hypothetical protein